MREGRPYQIDAIQAVRAAFCRGVRGVAVEQATGTGKGFEIASIARDAIAKKSRVLVLVNRDNLVQQLHDSLVEQGLYPRIERGMDHASPMSDLVVGSIQTLQGKRLEKWGRNHFHLVITDEAHFAAANTFKNTLTHFEAAYHVFFSATIERHDKAGLWAGVQERVFSYPLRQAIDDGWLVDYDLAEMPVPITLSDQQAAKKMWTEKDEENIFSTNDYLPRLFCEASDRIHPTLPSLFFWNGCCSSRDANTHFVTRGIDSRHVDGDMPKEEIRKILMWANSPGAKAIHCADLLSYGYDNIWIGLVGIMRIVRSNPMMKQRVGRATRPACVVDGLADAAARVAAIAASIKPRFTILDLMLQVGGVQNTFADATALITDDSDEREYIRQEIRKAGVPLTAQEIEGKLKAKRQVDKDAQLAKLCEDAANAAARAKLKRDGQPIFIADILASFNPAHKPATPGFIFHVRRKAKEWNTSIGEGPFSAHQLFRIKERIEAREKKLAQTS